MYLTTYASGSLPFSATCSSSMLIAKKAAMNEIGSYCYINFKLAIKVAELY